MRHYSGLKDDLTTQRCLGHGHGQVCVGTRAYPRRTRRACWTRYSAGAAPAADVRPDSKGHNRRTDADHLAMQCRPNEVVTLLEWVAGKEHGYSGKLIPGRLMFSSRQLTICAFQRSRAYAGIISASCARNTVTWTQKGNKLSKD